MAVIFLTGATGYIGGSILKGLLKNKEYKIHALVRDKANAEKVEAFGGGAVEAVLGSLEDLDLLKREAGRADVVLNTADAAGDVAAQALIKGLRERRKATGKEVHYIHTSGSSILAHPNSMGEHSNRIFNDTSDIYAFESSEPSYDFRMTDVGVIDAGLECGVKTYIVIPPTIYGLGSGPIKQVSIQIPILIAAAKASGKSCYVGEGAAIWSHVYIDDLVDLYSLLIEKALTDEAYSGKQGYYFAETGESSWKDVARAIARGLFKSGKIEKEEVEPFASLKEAASALTGGAEDPTMRGFASNSRCRAERSRALGWKATRPEEHFLDAVEAESAAA